MFKENQYWIIVTESTDDFKAAVKESDIPINSNVLLCIRREFTLFVNILAYLPSYAGFMK